MWLPRPSYRCARPSPALSGDADLRMRGSVGRPAVLGRVDILEGRATFHGIRFTLERGDITFANPVAIEPQLNLQASTHVRNYDLNITLVGTPSRGLNLNYRSEPPLPKSDIIALLALGRTNDESAQLQQQSGQSVFSDQASALILSQALNSTVSSRMERLFGASNIKIDPQGLNTETNPTARGPQVTIEQEFANNLVAHLLDQRFAKFAADHPGRVLFQPERLRSRHSRPKWRGEFRFTRAATEEIIAFRLSADPGPAAP